MVRGLKHEIWKENLRFGCHGEEKAKRGIEMLSLTWLIMTIYVEGKADSSEGQNKRSNSCCCNKGNADWI